MLLILAIVLLTLWVMVAVERAMLEIAVFIKELFREDESLKGDLEGIVTALLLEFTLEYPTRSVISIIIRFYEIDD